MTNEAQVASTTPTSTETEAETETATGTITTPKSEKAPVLDMNEIAMAHAYVTCHNVQDLLHLRGFTSKPANMKTKRAKAGGRKSRKDKS